MWYLRSSTSLRYLLFEQLDSCFMMTSMQALLFTLLLSLSEDGRKVWWLRVYTRTRQGYAQPHLKGADMPTNLVHLGNSLVNIVHCLLLRREPCYSIAALASLPCRRPFPPCPHYVIERPLADVASGP